MSYKIVLVTIILLALVVAGATGAVLYLGNKPQPVVPNNSYTPPEPKPEVKNFNEAVVLEKDKPILFENGVELTLTQINDSRCKEGVVCIWAGELAYQFHIEGGTVPGAGIDFMLATTTKKTITQNEYMFSLQSGTEKNVTIIVTKAATQNGCYVGGCSSEICSDQPGAISACIYKEEFACYQTAVCERQANNQCGWTQSTELKACLAGKQTP